MIALLRSGKAGEKYTIHRAAAEITREDVAALRRLDSRAGTLRGSPTPDQPAST